MNKNGKNINLQRQNSKNNKMPKQLNNHYNNNIQRKNNNSDINNHQYNLNEFNNKALPVISRQNNVINHNLYNDNLNLIQNNNNINGNNIPQIRSSFEKNNNPIYNSNLNNDISNILSKSKELKLRKQEEYKRLLDEQMKQEQERKEKERQIKYLGGINGLGSLNNNIIDALNSNNINMNNNTITKPSIEEKEKQRKKQVEYKEMLRQQLEEINKRKELEKQKEKEEEIKLEEKYKLQLIENQKLLESMKNKENGATKYLNNMESPDNFMVNPIREKPITQLNFYSQNNEINDGHPNYTTFPRFYDNNLNSTKNASNDENNALLMQSSYKNNSINENNEIMSNKNKSINSNYKGNFFNKNSNTNYLIHTRKSAIQYGLKPTPPQTTNNFSNISNNQINLPYIDTGRNSRPISQKQNKNNYPTWKLEEFYSNFVQGQFKIINEYEENINSYQNIKKNNFETIKDLMNIKNKTIEKIQNEQEEFKNNVEVYPMDINYNNKVINLLDMMLEKKINEIQKESKLEILSKKMGKEKNKENNENKENNDQINNNNEEYVPISEEEMNQNLIDCGYISKYEGLLSSKVKSNEASQEIRTSQSLEGFSKFVTQNKSVKQNQNKIENNNYQDDNNEDVYCNINNYQSNLFTTWKEEKMNQQSQNEINNNRNMDIYNKSLKNMDNNIELNQNRANVKTNEKEINLNNQNNKKINKNKNMSKDLLNDSQLPSKIMTDDKNIFNHYNGEMSGINISMQDSNNNVNNIINDSEFNFENEQASLIKTMKNQNNKKANNSKINNEPLNKLDENLQNNVKDLKISKGEKDKSLLLVGEIKNNLNHIGYTQNQKENKEKSYIIGNNTTLNNNENTLIINTANNAGIEKDKNNNINNDFADIIDDRLGDNLFNKESQEFENDNQNYNENMSLGATLCSKKNGGEINETVEDIVRGFGPSGMNSILNDENTSNFNLSNVNNSGANLANHNFGKKKGLCNTNKEIQQIKEAEEKEEEENYACDFDIGNKTLKKLEDEEKSKNSQKISFNDYNKIKESQKIQTQLNFFDESIIDNKNLGKSRGKLTNKSNSKNENNILISKGTFKSKNNNENNDIKNNNDNNDIKNNNDNNDIKSNENKKTNNMNIENSLFSNNALENDSFGDNIINNLDKYRNMMKEESSLNISKK